MISAVLVFSQAGTLLYSLATKNEVEPVLLSGFLSALKSFAKSNFVGGELKGIQIGKTFLDFQTVDFDHLGTFDVMLLTENIDPGTSHAILSNLAEKFAVFMDEKYQENPNMIKEIEKGKTQNFFKFNEYVRPILNSCQVQNSWTIEAKITVPNSVYDLITILFEEREDIAEQYANNPAILIEQLLMEFSANDIEDILRKRFNY